MLEQEINFALHLKLSGCILLKLTSNNPEAVGRIVKNCLEKAPSYEGRFLVELPMVDPKKLTTIHRGDLDAEESDEHSSDQWNIWYKFFASTDFHRMIEVSLLWNLVKYHDLIKFISFEARPRNDS